MRLRTASRASTALIRVREIPDFHSVRDLNYWDKFRARMRVEAAERKKSRTGRKYAIPKKIEGVLACGDGGQGVLSKGPLP